jgi:hypothetical protein
VDSTFCIPRKQTHFLSKVSVVLQRLVEAGHDNEQQQEDEQEELT